jgi:hypothetical protein
MQRLRVNPLSKKICQDHRPFLVCNMRAEAWFVPLDQNSVKWHTKEKVERP